MTTKLGYVPLWRHEHTKAVEKSLSNKGIENHMTTEQLDKAKNDLLNGLADGSIKTVEFSTYKEYLEKIYG